MSKTLKYRVLSQRNPEYNAHLAKKLNLLYEGGNQLLSNANLFIHQNPVEQSNVYRDRLSWAAYHNHFSEIWGEYLSNLFSKPLAVIPTPDANDPETPGEIPEAPEFYQEFSKDADLCENTFEEVLKEWVERAGQTGVAYLGVDFPNTEELTKGFLEKEMEEVSIADEKQFGLSRAYVYNIPYEAIVDWEINDLGKFKWCILENICTERGDITQERDSKRYNWKYWYYNESGAVCWEEYERIYTVKEGMPKLEDDIPMIAEGSVSFKCIPISILCLPVGLWIGNQLLSMLLENFKLRSMLNFSMSRASNEIPFFQMSNELEQIGNPLAEDSGRAKNFKADLQNKGFLVGTDKDMLSFVGPKGAIFQVLSEYLKDNVNEMHRIHHIMASTMASKGNSNSGSSAKSGIAKQNEHDSMARNLLQYAIYIKNSAREVYEVIADARGEDIPWQVVGMDDFSFVDDELLWKKATELDKCNIPSKTFKKHQLTDIAIKLSPELDPTALLQIKKEIDDAVEGAGLEGFYDRMVSGHLQDAQDTADAAKSNNINSLGGKGQNGSSGSQSALKANSGAANAIDKETGHLQANPSEHIATGEYVDPRTVYDSIKGDYNHEDMKWILQTVWKGPVLTPLSSIDLSNSDKWTASKPGPDGQDKVDDMSEKMADTGQWKPVILLNTPHNNQKLQVSDGRHRILSAKKLGIDVLAYIGETGSTDPNTDAMMMHGKQQSGKS